MGKIVEVEDIVYAVLYLAQAGSVERCCTWTVVLTPAVGSRSSNFTNSEINDLR
jgi:hypothetical protein